MITFEEQTLNQSPAHTTCTSHGVYYGFKIVYALLLLDLLLHIVHGPYWYIDTNSGPPNVT
jgi:hypothetical protein